MKKEKFGGAEFRKMSVAEEGVHFCEPEKGDILGEDDMAEDRITTCLMDYVESSNQHEDVLTEEPIEDREPYVFKYDDLCMTVGCETEEVRQSFGTITKTSKDGDMLSERITT